MQKIIILDFGSQTTQLIGRRVRELNTFCEIVPPDGFPADDTEVIGVILSGSPWSVLAEGAPHPALDDIIGRLPALGICYGAQLLAHTGGGTVTRTAHREYGRAALTISDPANPLLDSISTGAQVWMSHGDTITSLPPGCHVIGSTHDVPVAAWADDDKPVWGVQFHPEVHHTTVGMTLLRNFVVGICGSRGEWTAAAFVPSAIAELRRQIGDDRVVMGLSGGVDSTVCAALIGRAIGDRLTCIFIDHGLLRKNEYHEVMDAYHRLGLSVKGVDASARFLGDLAGVSDPEQKRKIIGRDFVEVFNAEARRIAGARWLGQGTIYPDRIESLSPTGTVIKSHHNVGGLPKEMNLRLCEPLRWLFKDEVRAVGRELGLPATLVERHPFPGPGLAVRIVGEVTEERVRILQEADDIFVRALHAYRCPDGRSLYEITWQAGAVLLADIRTVGVMGDERTYDYPVVLRAVTSTDAMTADWARLPQDFLADVADEIINKVKGVNRVCYDISSKPPSTIEWE
ncbi:MAG: glutamine-hydrolyzing GMP synthase [Bacteroidaceae bacterium]|nr:glutamine-hydrolyzing GMP synthase [Bacteroidaceae bacterium]